MNIIDEPENRLERLLRLAATEPAHRPEFCKLLLDTTVFVLGHTEDELPGEKTLEEGSTVSLQHWNNEEDEAVIPFFSSVARLQEAVEKDESYLEMPARALFEITLGSVLVLNPLSEYSKEFYPEEIDSMLDSGVGMYTQQIELEQDKEILIGEPDEYPSMLVDSLTTLFSKHDSIENAWLGLIQDADEQQSPNFIIGIEGKGDMDTLIHEAGTVAWDVSDGEEVIDFVIVEQDDEGISQYFLKECKPFYEKKWGSKLSSITEPGKA